MLTAILIGFVVGVAACGLGDSLVSEDLKKKIKETKNQILDSLKS